MKRPLRFRPIAVCLVFCMLAPLTYAAAQPPTAVDQQKYTTIATKDLGNYTVEIYQQAQDAYFVTFRIVDNRNTEVVFSDLENEASSIYVLHKQEVLSVSIRNPQPKRDVFDQPLDFDGDGIDEVIIDLNAGGQQCCDRFLVFKLTPQFMLLGDVASERFGHVEDSNGDGKPEIWVADAGFAIFEDVCEADAPRLYVPLHFRKGAFTPDLKAMKREIDPERVGRWTAWANEREVMPEEKTVPPYVWAPVPMCWYSGQPEAAREFFDEHWPKDRPGKAAFWQRMLDEVKKKSHYYDALKQLNGW